ncbi:hypothetical protein B0H14DRAFT_3706584 [Mycena olivaceomarginata]|nr:hypothetical protein B0H14DRAFT_3706584 [Mycena olivaceomarginata]
MSTGAKSAISANAGRRRREFPSFATALKILVGSSIHREGLNRAKQLLEDYLGPWGSPSFWDFLPERLNKVLRNLNTNNWGGGLLEVSMMREFHRMAQLDGMLNGILDETSGENLPLWLRLEHQFIQVFFDHWRKEKPWEQFEHRYSRLASLDSFAETYSHAFLDGRRITPTTCSRRGSASALIQIRYKGKQYSGEIHTILQHKRRGIPKSEPIPLAFVLWMIPGDKPLDNGSFMWNDFLELGVETWLYKKYAPTNDPNYPPQVLPLADIKSQISRGKIGFTIPPL